MTMICGRCFDEFTCPSCGQIRLVPTGEPYREDPCWSCSKRIPVNEFHSKVMMAEQKLQEKTVIIMGELLYKAPCPNCKRLALRKNVSNPENCWDCSGISAHGTFDETWRMEERELQRGDVPLWDPNKPYGPTCRHGLLRCEQCFAPKCQRCEKGLALKTIKMNGGLNVCDVCYERAYSQYEVPDLQNQESPRLCDAIDLAFGYRDQEQVSYIPEWEIIP